jgi:alpha-beta hydrolase superfamily lysophospholipase
MRPVVLCPAQFGTAEDYTQLKQDLRARGFDLYAAPLRRFDWFKIVPATLTMDFFTASLKPAKTLGFFYEALDKAFAQVEADYGPDAQVAVLGHSIGGWVARSYIGEQMGAELASRRVCSLVTLGTPHNPPPADSPIAALDQTRGLLTYINQRFPSGSPLPSTMVTVSAPPPALAGSGSLCCSWLTVL